MLNNLYHIALFFEWIVKSLVNYICLFFFTRGFKLTIKMVALINFIEYECGTKVYISGYDFHPIWIWKNSGAVMHHPLDLKPHIIIWPYKNENEFLTTLAHEFGHIIMAYQKASKNLGKIQHATDGFSVVRREQDAWYYAYKILNFFFPQNKELFQTFDKLYDSSMKSYLDVLDMEYIMAILTTLKEELNERI